MSFSLDEVDICFFKREEYPNICIFFFFLVIRAETMKHQRQSSGYEPRHWESSRMGHYLWVKRPM